MGQILFIKSLVDIYLFNYIIYIIINLYDFKRKFYRTSKPSWQTWQRKYIKYIIIKAYSKIINYTISFIAKSDTKIKLSEILECSE